jgi:hypothetical protein
MNPIDLDCTSESEMPSVPALIEILRSGGRLSCSGHTLSLVDRAHGPTILWGTNAYGQDYWGSLTVRYVRWWRQRMMDRECVGPCPSEPARDENVVHGFFDAMPEIQPGPEQQPKPYVPSSWAQRAVATRIVALLDDEAIRCYHLSDIEHALQRLRGKDVEYWRVHSRPDYPGLQALCGIRFLDMDHEVAAGLPAALLHVLGLDDDQALSVLGDFAASVVERYARGVVPQSPPVTALKPTGLRRLFGGRAAA